MTSFAQTVEPCPFGTFNGDVVFQHDADAMVTFVRRKLGDGVTSVELSKRDIWTCFEEATFEYGNVISRYQLKSDLAVLLGLPTVYSSSIVSGSVATGPTFTNMYLRRTNEFLLRQTDPVSSLAGTGGSYDRYLAYIDLTVGQQDYDLYSSDLKRADGSTAGTQFVNTIPSGSIGKLRINEVMHFEPLAAQNFLLNASNITNFLATSFNFESYVNSTIFYVLPVYEDVLRRGMLETANRVRRSNFTYELVGRKLRLFPIPGGPPQAVSRIYLWVSPASDPTNPSIYGPSDSTNTSTGSTDPSLNGIANPAMVPYGPVMYAQVNQPGKNWIREYTLALSTELLGIIRSKMKTIPIPGNDLTLNGDELRAQGREDKEKLVTDLREFMDSLTYDKLLEVEAQKSQNMIVQMRTIPFPNPVSIR